MANDSSTGGYLQPGPSPAPPSEDDALAILLQGMVVGITGLPGGMVRPRWQAVAPKQPEASVNWCAIGVTVSTPDDNPAVLHEGDGDGRDRLIRHLTIELLATFYGPASAGYAGMLRDGLYIAQNWEVLAAQGFGLINVGEALPVPELVNQQWIRRHDMRARMRRAINRTYPVLNILSAPFTIERT